MWARNYLARLVNEQLQNMDDTMRLLGYHTSFPQMQLKKWEFILAFLSSYWLFWTEAICVLVLLENDTGSHIILLIMVKQKE
jgi:hypothetical protein